jgi:RND family efflux transporter MFP subunit
MRTLDPSERSPAQRRATALVSPGSVEQPGEVSGRVGSVDPSAGPVRPDHHPAEAATERAVAIPKDLPRVSTAQAIVAAGSFVALLTGLFLLGYFPDRARRNLATADAAAARDRVPVVNVITPKRQPRSSELMLPADVQAYQYTAIYSRANGYLKRLLVDIGDHVAADQLLAEIDTPEVDAQLDQARANAAQARVNLVKARTDLALAKLTYERYESVTDKRAVSQQDVDDKRTQYEQAQASVDVAQAAIESVDSEVRRLEVLQGFEKVVAPFAGTITARNFDVGALVSPATTSGARELFQIARTDVLRVFVNVPQADAPDVQLGQSADLLVRNFPDRAFAGNVTRTAGAVNPSTRTLRVEVDVSNATGELFAGMYGQVRFQIMQPEPPLVIPTSALIYNADGLHVAVVEQGKVHFQSISIGRDFGNELEIVAGLTGHESIVSNPGERLSEGLAVKVVAAADGHPALARSLAGR